MADTFLTRAEIVFFGLLAVLLAAEAALVGFVLHRYWPLTAVSTVLVVAAPSLAMAGAVVVVVWRARNARKARGSAVGLTRSYVVGFAFLAGLAVALVVVTWDHRRLALPALSLSTGAMFAVTLIRSIAAFCGAPESTDD